MEVSIVEKELSYKVVETAFEVHNLLGPGYLEAIYEEALYRELCSRGHRIERQKRILVYYKGSIIGEHLLDLVVEGKVILELKATTQIAPIHKQQALSYLKATGLPLALVINFGESRLKYDRVVLTRGSDLPPKK